MTHFEVGLERRDTLLRRDERRLAACWRITAEGWRRNMGRAARLWREQRRFAPAHAQHFLATAVECRDRAALSLAKAAALERGKP